MITTIKALRDKIHFEPITALALERYALVFEEEEWKFKSKDQSSLKDLDFVVDLAALYEAPTVHNFGELNNYSFSIILDYLRRTHHFYIHTLLPKMEMTVRQLQRSFEGHPVVYVLGHFYQNYQNELLEHIELEESRLFPYAEALYDGKPSKVVYSLADFKMHHNHDMEDHLQDMLIVLEDQFPEVCESFAYRSFNHLLNAFRDDLQVHHMIEEDIFLMKVETLEESLLH